MGELIPLLLALASGDAQAQQPADACPPCDGDPACLQQRARCLVQADQARQAVTEVKKACKNLPGDGACARLLAWSYHAAGNQMWADKTLLAQVGRTPTDTESRTWAVWFLLQSGDLARARQLLDTATTTTDPLLTDRLTLLRVALEHLSAQEEQASDLLAPVSRAAELLPEDLALLREMRRQVLGDVGAPWSTRVELAGGYTSNAVQSAPQDAGSGQETAGAALAGLDSVLRWEPWTSPRARPLGEVRVKGLEPMSELARGFSYLSLGARTGGELGRMSDSRVRGFYSFELMGLQGTADDASLPVEGGWFMEAHRAEIEADLPANLQLFGGGGRRVYRELARTRSEFDLGLASVVPLGGGWSLTGIAAGRRQLARNSAYDDWGATALLRLAAPLPGQHMLKARGMLLWDKWPSSADYYESDQARRDLVVKTEIGPWTRSYDGWRCGLTWSWSLRDSSVDDYSYQDHRFLLKLRWQQSWDPALPAAAQVDAEHLPLPYGLQQGADSGLDRVQDLLRQEDSARRGSSCVD